MADEMDGYLEQAQRSDAYQPLLAEAISALRQGDAARFKPLLSANLRRAAGDATVDHVIGEQLIPFFAAMADFGSNTTVTPATDAYGSDGLSFYKSIRTADGAEQPFVIYIVEEAGRPVVANLLIHTTYADMHGGQEPGE